MKLGLIKFFTVILSLLLVLTACTNTEIASTDSEDTKIDWRSAYVDFLKNDFKTDCDDPRFAFIYVDDDDIPELIIGE